MHNNFRSLAKVAFLYSIAWPAPDVVRFIFVALVSFAAFVPSETAVAIEWSDSIKKAYDKAKHALQEQAQVVNDDAIADPAVAPALPLAESLPKEIAYSLFIEPVFNAEMWVAQAGKEHHQTVVLIHGLGQQAHRDWLAQISALAKRYHVLTFDLPGFGYSGVPEGRYSPSNYAEVVYAVVQQFGKSTPVIVGHSMGGAVGLRYAHRYPAGLTKLILVDAAGILEKTAFVKHIATAPADKAQLPKALQGSWAQVKDFSGSLLELGTLHDPARDLLNESDVAWRLLLSNTPNTNAALSLVEEDFSEAVRNLKHPPIILWGRQDAVAPLRTGKVLTALIDGAQLHVIDGAAHVPMSSHTEIFNALLMTALEPAEPGGNNSSAEDRATFPTQATVVAPDDEARDLVCRNESSLEFTGHFRNIALKNCTNITLRNVTAQSLVAKDSLVHAENLHILAVEKEAQDATGATGVRLTESVLVVTNGRVEAAQAFWLSGSRLDIAGVSIQAAREALVARKSSRIVASLSHISSPVFTGNLHGSYALKKQSLTMLLGDET